MIYEPLHHKYRPQTFAQLVGQEAITTTLSNALRLGRIAPAYLFTGPRGTGKTSSARILAKSLNCLSSDTPTEQPCGKCEVCLAIASGSALDIIEIDAASNTGVDNIREVIERAQFAPVQCRHKVYIIDEVHMLSTAAFNALLKTLEEPPERVVFVLATTDPQRVLPTIISRCQRFDFRRIRLDAMVKHLREIANQENIDITDEAVTLVAQVAQGGLRDAESLLDQLSLLAGQVTIEKIWDLVGTVPERDLMAIARAIASNNPEAVLDRTRYLMDKGREPLIVLQNLASFYRDLLIAKTAPSRPDLVAVTAPTWKALCEFEQLDIVTILQGQKHLKDSEVQIKNTTQPRLWLEVTLLGLLPATLNFQPQTEIRQSHHQNSSVRSEIPSSKPEALPKPEIEVQPPANPSPPPQPPTPDVPQPQMPSEQVANGLLSQEQSKQLEPTSSASQPPEIAPKEPDLNQLWQKVLTCLEPISTRELLRQLGVLIYFEGQEARISLPQSWRENIQNKLPNIEEAFQKVLNFQVRVKLEVVYPTQNNTAFTKKPSYPGSPPKASPSRNFQLEPSPEVRQDNAVNSPTTTPPDETSSKVPSPGEIEDPKASSIVEITAPPPQPPVPQVPDWKVAEVENAARSLAQFFAGEIIPIADDLDLGEPAAINYPQPEEFFKPGADEKLDLSESTATDYPEPEEFLEPPAEPEIDPQEDEDIPF